MTPRVRIAPSPTGNLHIGTARTALFNFLFARKEGGVFIVRIEDTDKERNKPEYEKNIIDGFNWLGIKYDEFYRQSERIDSHKKWLKKLIDENKAYLSKEEEGGNRDEVIRFRNPNRDISFEDTVRGQVSFNTEELGDFVIARSMDEPLYHFAVVVDDFEMNINHVIRGEDHISNTPRQILIQEAIGAPRPKYSHIPLILAKDRSKMSKRHGAVSINEFKDRGFLPEAMVNYLALLGWHPDDDREIFSMKELVEVFDLSRIQKGGAIFDENKLLWVNKEHIKRMPEEERKKIIIEKIIQSEKSKDREWGSGEDLAGKIEPLISERISKWSEVDELMASGDLDYFFEKPVYGASVLNYKGEQEKSDIIRHLNTVGAILQEQDEKELSAEKVKGFIWSYAEKEGRGAVLWPFRVALSGKDKSPDPFVLAQILGKKETSERIKEAVRKIDAETGRK